MSAQGSETDGGQEGNQSQNPTSPIASKEPKSISKESSHKRKKRRSLLSFPHIDDRRRKKSLRLGVVEGGFATIHGVLTGGKFLVGYLMILGATPFHFGLLNAIPFVFQSFQILSVYLTNIVKSRKTVSLVTSLLGRLIWIVCIVLLFVDIPLQSKILVFLIFYGLYHILMILGGNAWLMWMDELIPLEVRGRYIALRNAFLLLITISIDWLGSKILDYSNKGQDIWGFIIIFGIAIVCALFAGLSLKKQWEPPFKSEPMLPLRSVLREISRNKNYLSVIRFFVIWNFGIGVAAAFWHPHMLTNLKMTYSDIWVYAMVTGGVGFFSSLVWGHLQDKAGTKPILILTGSIIFTFPLIWLTVTAENRFPIYLEGILSGIFWVGFNTAAFNIPLITAPPKFRAYFLAVFASATGISFALASLVGGIIAEWLIDWHIVIMGHDFVNYHVIFLMSSTFRIIGLYFLLGVKEVKSQNIGYLLDEIGLGMQKASYYGRQFVTIPFHWLRKGKSADNETTPED